MGTGGSSSHGRGGGPPMRNAVFGRDPMLPGYREFATQGEAVIYHRANNFDMDRWRNGLTGDERQGIVGYTDFWYSAINTSLREGKPSASNVQDMINGATTGLGKFQAAEDVVTFRGANLHWTANLLGGTEAQMSDSAFLRSRIGRVVRDKGFMSSGTHPDSSWAADVTYKIYVNKGIKGMYVDPVSANRGEYEFLFNRDTSFRVHSITTDSRGRITKMTLEAIRSRH